MTRTWASPYCVATASPVAVPEPALAAVEPDPALDAELVLRVAPLDGVAVVGVAVAVWTVGAVRVEGQDAGRAGDGGGEDDGGSTHGGLRLRR